MRTGGPFSDTSKCIHGDMTTTLWLFNIAMENDAFIDDFPIKTSIYNGFSMAMLNNQMVERKCQIMMPLDLNGPLQLIDLVAEIGRFRATSVVCKVSFSAVSIPQLHLLSLNSNDSNDHLQTGTAYL